MSSSYYKVCKYGCNTQIKWDNEDSLFREADGRAHDRDRCQRIRGVSASGGGAAAATRTATQTVGLSAEQPIISGINQEDWKTLLAAIVNNTSKLDQLSEYYGGIVDQLGLLNKLLSKDQGLADKEAQFDHDKEEGLI